MKELLSFVIPCYRSENTISDVVFEIVKSFEQDEKREFEVILVNDGSPDNTYSVIRQLCAHDGRIRGVNLSRNFGQHAATLAGMKRAKGDIVILLDDDGQTPPAQAMRLVEQVDAGHDVAIARYPHKKHGFFRNMGSKLNNYMARVMIGKPKGLYLSSFVAMKRYVADEVCAYKFPYPYLSGILIRTTNDIVNVDVEHREREVGESGYTVRKLLALWFNGFTNFSIKPLRAATVLGAIIAIAGFAVGIYAIVVKLIEPEAPLGWASTTAVVAFIGGIILVMLGLIGEYIGRMFMGLNQTPQFVVKETVNTGEEDGPGKE